MSRRASVLAADPRGVGAAAFAALGGPLAWVVHFMGSYVLVALACTTGWEGLGATLAAATVMLAIVAGATTIVGLRGWRRTRAPQRLDAALNEPRGWRAFLMLSGIVLGALSAFTIVLQGLSALLVPACSQSGVIP
ncbi:MAG TPA: hypothetical protein VF037_06985 [Gemmatimonadales bacterium]